MKTVYELSQSDISYLYFIPLIPLVLCAVFLYYIIRYKHKSFLTIIIPFAFLLSLWGSISSLYKIYNDQKMIIEPYFKGSYQYVEGYVENFRPYTGNGTEEFTVDNIDFVYPYFVTEIGYINRKVGKGIIRYNGQYVCIRYITLEDEEKDINVIVRIDVQDNQIEVA